VNELCGQIHWIGLGLDPLPDVYLHQFTYFADQVPLPLVQTQTWFFLCCLCRFKVEQGLEKNK
jgi:hypothetical protein